MIIKFYIENDFDRSSETVEIEINAVFSLSELATKTSQTHLLKFCREIAFLRGHKHFATRKITITEGALTRVVYYD